jgi:hypothetical protein
MRDQTSVGILSTHLFCAGARTRGNVRSVETDISVVGVCVSLSNQFKGANDLPHVATVAYPVPDMQTYWLLRCFIDRVQAGKGVKAW